MARQPRLHVPGGVYHVILRGNGGQEVFFDDQDRHHLYELLEQGVTRYRHRIHGFCCMPNHLHLVIQVKDHPLSPIMQNLSFRYTRWINQKYQRHGHLFQGRYQAILVEADQYLLALVRYIHLNPVRAGLAKDPKSYAGSSHRAYLGQEQLPWVCTEWVLGYFAKRVSTSRQRFAAFVQAGKDEGHREEFHKGGTDGRVLADDRFLEKIGAREKRLKPAVSLATITRFICQEYDVRERDLSRPARRRVHAQARGMIGWLARHVGAASIQDMARAWNRDASTVSRQIGSIDASLSGKDRLPHQLRRSIKSITQA